ncbi:MAG TPA: NAD(P)/FAD-dependent oxidoreductase [Nitrososphaeraceae archaeon]|nr:NAD(P)/FAD-dependent oxidoreductase [Nitrososphaeraceae archaeon]
MRDDTTVLSAVPDTSPTISILILGSGFGGVEVLRRLQKKFKNDKDVEITLISEDNFFLFTPMLHEVSTGTIETRHIITPMRSFCKNAKFYEAKIESIDLKSKTVVTNHLVGRQSDPYAWHKITFSYDYLVIALGSKTDFYGMKDIKQQSFTMKTINDALILRNHILRMLEQASIEHSNKELRKSLLTFVVVGGGFGGVETVGGLNDFVRGTVREYYKDIYMTEIKILLVSAEESILSEIDENLGKYALERLRDRGVEFIVNTHANGATQNSLKLDNGNIILCHTIVWEAGVTSEHLIKNLPCTHDKGGRIQTNSYMEVEEYTGVYAVGDCASIPNPNTGKPYPPTAQHAIREGRTAAKNIVSSIRSTNGRAGQRHSKKEKLDYKAKGIMANIGNRNGVAIIFGVRLHGFIAWFLWRTFYLSNLPVTKKKLKVMSDWTMDLIFKPDVAMLKGFTRYPIEGKNNDNNNETE